MEPPVAIVLGAAVWPGGVPSRALRRRAERAAALYLDGTVRGLVATGGVGRHPPSEAAAIREIVLTLGVPADAVVMEEGSTSTLENLAHAYALLPARTPVIIVTDLWHLPRARLTAHRLGMTARGAAPSLRGAHPGRVLRAALREVGALTWYLVRPIRRSRRPDRGPEPKQPPSSG